MHVCSHASCMHAYIHTERGRETELCEGSEPRGRSTTAGTHTHINTHTHTHTHTQTQGGRRRESPRGRSVCVFVFVCVCVWSEPRGRSTTAGPLASRAAPACRRSPSRPRSRTCARRGPPARPGRARPVGPRAPPFSVGGGGSSLRAGGRASAAPPRPSGGAPAAISPQPWRRN